MKENEAFDRKIFEEDPDIRFLIGVDEAGRGPLAGPLSIGLFIQSRQAAFQCGVTDSKKMSPSGRGRVFSQLKQQSFTSWAVSLIPPRIIDDVNIYEATRRGMEELLLSLPAWILAKARILVDAMTLRLPELSVTSLVRCDSLSYTVGAASIMAKEIRDRYMERAALRYPGYHFEQNRGYPTKGHLMSLKAAGPSPIHRMSYRPVQESVRQTDTRRHQPFSIPKEEV